jgi:WD40 repeat protein
MPELEERFRELAAGRPPDLWEAIEDRARQGAPHVPQRRRALAAAVSLGLAIAAITALVVIFARAPSKPEPAETSFEGTSVPEGRLVIQLEGLVQIAEPGEQLQYVTSGVFAHDVSADGSTLLAERHEERRLFTIDVTTGKRSVIATVPEDEGIGDAALAPDGSLAAFVVGGLGHSRVCVAGPNPDEHRCFPEAGWVSSIDWSPDGRSFVAAGHSDHPVQVIDPLTGKVRPIVAQRGSTPINRALEAEGIGTSVQLDVPTWSPSGRYLAALASLDGGPYLYVPVVFDLEGNFVAMGRPSREAPTESAWSPVDDLLAYTRGDPPYQIDEVYLVDPETGEDRAVLIDEGVVRSLAFSPSGRWLAVGMWDGSRGPGHRLVRVLDILGESAPIDLELPPGQDAAPGLPGWTP